MRKNRFIHLHLCECCNIQHALQKAIPFESTVKTVRSRRIEMQLESEQWLANLHFNFKSFTQLLVFSVTPFKIDQNKKSKPFNRLSPEAGNKKKVDMLRQTLAKIQVTAIFLMEDMRINVFPKFIEICMETPCWCPSTWAPTWRPETSRNISHRVLLQKREFISRGTKKRNNNTLF